MVELKLPRPDPSRFAVQFTPSLSELSASRGHLTEGGRSHGASSTHLSQKPLVLLYLVVSPASGGFSRREAIRKILSAGFLTPNSSSGSGRGKFSLSIFNLRSRKSGELTGLKAGVRARVRFLIFCGNSADFEGNTGDSSIPDSCEDLLHENSTRGDILLLSQPISAALSISSLSAANSTSGVPAPNYDAPKQTRRLKETLQQQNTQSPFLRRGRTGRSQSKAGSRHSSSVETGHGRLDTSALAQLLEGLRLTKTMRYHRVLLFLSSTLPVPSPEKVSFLPCHFVSKYRLKFTYFVHLHRYLRPLSIHHWGYLQVLTHTHLVSSMEAEGG
jgi:hypothetical protein